MEYLKMRAVLKRLGVTHEEMDIIISEVRKVNRVLDSIVKAKKHWSYISEDLLRQDVLIYRNNITK